MSSGLRGDATADGATAAEAAELKAGNGLISVFVHHPTAPNLLMLVLVLIGLFSIGRLNRQFFPNLEVPVITVQVPWPGASAEDVETNVLDVLEPELRFLDDVEEVTSIAREGSGVITIEFVSTADLQKAQSDIEQAVTRVVTLPEDSERPIISRAALFDPVAKVAISGPFAETVLKDIAKDLRDGMLASGIDRVTLTGAREEEIWIAVSEGELRRLGLTIEEIALRVRQNTQDLPAGKLEGDIEVQLRAKAERKTPEAIGDIEVVSRTTGEKVFLRDIAAIDTRFEREGKIGLLHGERAIELNVQRALAADTLKTMEALEAYLEAKRPTLPASLRVEVYDVRGKFVSQRLAILVENGMQGLVLVLVMLFIFLNARIAFWVALGIPVSLLAALGVMYLTGQSINMVSMFALIMMLGIIVDDAIVVGEEAATLEEQGKGSLIAAELAGNRMLGPVLAATITTMCAFMPIALIGGRIGDIFIAIPLVVMSVLIASTIECFLILPGHLRHGGAASERQVSLPRRVFDRGFGAFRDGPVRLVATLAYDWRYTTFATAMAGLVLVIGLLAGGRIGFQFFPSPESENITGVVEFAAGTPRDVQADIMRRIEASLFEAEAELLAKAKSASAGEAIKPAGNGGTADGVTFADDDDRTIDWLMQRIGSALGLVEDSPIVEDRLVVASFALLGQADRAQGDNVAQIDVELTPSEVRSVRTKTVIDAWRGRLPKIAGVERIALSARRQGPPGRDVDVRLQNAPVDFLKRAAEEVKLALTGFPGVSGVNDDLPYGKQEYVFELSPRGAAMGFTGQTMGAQLRAAFEGTIATRFARGDEEVTVRVLRRQAVGGRQDLEHVYLTTPTGQRVALSEVATLSERRTFSIIQRRDGVRTVAVTGDIDAQVTSVEAVVSRLDREILPAIAAKYGIGYEFRGRDEERRESFADLQAGALLALSLIYITLAWVFGSYWQPIAVMSIIPFGSVGAIFGHYVMGYDLTIISMIGLLGLSGILVNDSIVLVSRINERRAEGAPLREACIGASQDRLRAVLLTSLTTIGGLAPLMFETSQQAQFLIPMAITLVFGLATSTLLVLLLVPAITGIAADGGRVIAALQRFYRPARVT
ncbi:MAG: efflux RND transporter permease subunit [Hyphomicrobiaceae bacterium]|nr:efflux RND transporter permease subunit [Hyphomicrobiaceae bacterium]